jgi:hypothetical protein
MQYIIIISGDQASPWIQYFDNSGINNPGNTAFATLPKHNTLPAGWSLEIALGNDSSGNVNSINLSVIDDQGGVVGSQSMPLPTHSTTGSQALDPIMAFTVNVVSPPGTSSTSFTSGSGCITYEVPDGSDSICAVQNINNCPTLAPITSTTENSNLFYGPIKPNCDTTLGQAVSATTS